LSKDDAVSNIASPLAEAEASFLGACILSDGKAALEYRQLLHQDTFKTHNYGLIAEAIGGLLDKGSIVDLVTLCHDLSTRKNRDNNWLELVGGEDAVIHVAETVPSVKNIGHYAQIVREAYQRRKILQSAKELAERCNNRDASISEVIAKSQEVASTTASLMPKKVFTHIRDIDIVQEKEVGISTGFDGLDSQISMGGFPSGQLSVVRAYHKGGKCWGLGTKIRMADSTVKEVQDIVVGDLVMGPDSNPRTVLSLARGTDAMYRITPARGHESWSCNGAHILVLVNRQTGREWEESVGEYLNRSDASKGSIQMKYSAYDGEYKDVFDPYLAGIWLGDGTLGLPHISAHVDDAEIIDYIWRYGVSTGNEVKFSKKRGLGVLVRINNRGGTLALREYAESASVGGKHIPHEYFTASLEQRLRLLAGIIDSDGHRHNNGYDLVFKGEAFARQVVELARGCGLCAVVKECSKGIKSTGFTGTYWRICIYGNTSIIPVLLPRKKCQPSRRNGNGRMSFTIEPIGAGEYYGFELSDDGLLLLADGTVNHNSTFLVQAGLCAANRGLKVLYATFADLNRKHIKRRMMRMLTGYQYPPEGGGLFDDWHKTMDDLNDKHIDVYDVAEADDGGTVEEFTAWAESTAKTQGPWDLVLVDYAQELVSGSRRIADKMGDQMECARVLNRFASRTKIATVVGSQITMDMNGGRKTKWGRDWEEKAGWVLTIVPPPPGSNPLEMSIEISYSRFGPQAPRSSPVPVRFNTTALMLDEVAHAY